MIRLLSPIFIATFVAFWVLPASVQATTISLGSASNSLLPNTPNQSVPVLITGGNENNIVGTDLFVLIGDGGPERTFGTGLPGTDAPGMENLPGDANMTGVGTLFGANNAGQADQFSGLGGSIPQLIGYSMNTNSGTVSDSPTSILAFLKISTVGFTSGSWPVRFDDTTIGGSDATDLVLSGSQVLHPTLLAGTISIVPEPATTTLAAMGALGLLAWAARRRKLSASRK